MLIGLVSLFLLWWQNKQINKWNKLNSPYNFINVSLLSELSRKYFDAFDRLDIDPHKFHLSDKDTDAIYEDNEAFISVTAYLNHLENICTAISIGCADDDCAYAVHANGIMRSYNKFDSFISKMRKSLDDDEIYIELEKVACKYLEQDASTVKKRKRNYIDNKGVQKKI
jgi:hypothetical protein